MKLAESFGAKGYEVGAAGELAPTLRKALDDDAVTIAACPVDYRENARLIEFNGLTDSDLTQATSCSTNGRASGWWAWFVKIRRRPVHGPEPTG